MRKYIIYNSIFFIKNVLYIEYFMGSQREKIFKILLGFYIEMKTIQ